MQRHVDRPISRLVTDDPKVYRTLGRDPGRDHHYVRHSNREHARKDVNQYGATINVHVNNAESFVAILRRGFRGIWHSVSEQHLHRYINAAQFRFNSRKPEDGERTAVAIRGAVGKRLFCRELVAKPAA